MSEGAVATTRAPAFGLWERMLARRYLLATRSETGLALVTLICLFGVTLAVAILVIVMSVMNGFRAELLSKILGFNGHVFVQGGVLDNAQTRDLAVQRIIKVPGVTQAAPVIEAQAIALGPSQATGAMVRGLSPQDFAANRIVSGNITHGSAATYGRGDYGGDGVVVGERLADSLGVKVGDTVSLISPSGGATAFGGTPLQKPYTVIATFTAGMSQYDQGYIFMPLAQAQLFFGREGTVDAIEIKLADPDKAPKLKADVQRAAGPAAMVSDWTQRDTAYWSALKIEHIVMGLILSLLIVIAALNIISGLVMLVKNKGRDIAILRTIGANQASILRVFFMTGVAIGGVGTAAGLVLGILVSVYIDPIQTFVEWITGAKVFSAEVYFLSRIPAKVDWPEVALIAGFSLVMSMIWTLPAAWRASRLDPVEALRYE